MRPERKNGIGFLRAAALALPLAAALALAACAPQPLSASPAPLVTVPQETVISSASPAAVSPLPAPTVDARLQKAISVNKDVVGWITIPGTSIDFPVVQAPDNAYYLTHDAKRKPSRSGAIFMDCRSEALMLGGNVVLYGHHMRDGTMFAHLLDYKQSDFFDAHGVIEYDTPQGLTRWRVFAAYETTTAFCYIRTSFDSPDAYLALLREMQDKSLYSTDTVLTARDAVLTLSTCTYDIQDGRFVVNAVRIQ